MPKHDVLRVRCHSCRTAKWTKALKALSRGVTVLITSNIQHLHKYRNCKLPVMLRYCSLGHCLFLHFNGNFPGGPALAGTRMSQFGILLELRMMVVVSGDNWSYKTCKALVIQSPPTNQHPAFPTGQMSFLSPNQQCQSTEGK